MAPYLRSDFDELYSHSCIYRQCWMTYSLYPYVIKLGFLQDWSSKYLQQTEFQLHGFTIMCDRLLLKWNYRVLSPEKHLITTVHSLQRMTRFLLLHSAFFCLYSKLPLHNISSRYVDLELMTHGRRNQWNLTFSLQ